MNIFYLDQYPTHAARYHCDKHVVKMILETAQLLCTAHRVLDGDENVPPYFYKKTHVNHPCAIWVRENTYNYEWTRELFQYLNEEYSTRYKKIHKCKTLFYPDLFSYPKNIKYGKGKTPIPLAMPDDCKVDNNPVLSYRRYYKRYKANIAKWTSRPIPYWWKDIT